MSVYLAFDTDQDGGSQVATIAGWGDFTRWAGSLKGAPQLAHLVAHGWSQHLAAMADELTAALKDHAPGDADTRGVADGLLSLLGGRGGAEVAVITEGLVPAGEGSTANEKG